MFLQFLLLAIVGVPADEIVIGIAVVGLGAVTDVVIVIVVVVAAHQPQRGPIKSWSLS